MTNPALPHGLDRTLLLPALLMLGKKREENYFRFRSRNPLKSLDSHERIQGNPRKSNGHERGLSQRKTDGPRKPKRMDLDQKC
jgi:hypothetical protein